MCLHINIKKNIFQVNIIVYLQISTVGTYIQLQIQFNYNVSKYEFVLILMNYYMNILNNYLFLSL